MLAKIVSAGVLGIEAYRVEVEADVARALPNFSVVGLPDGAVKESRDRLRAALKNSGFAFPQLRVTVNLAPADVKKEGTAFDLPMALAVLAADGQLEAVGLERTLFLGELALDGSVRPVRGVLPVAAEARRLGVERLVVPRENGSEAAVVEDVEVFLASSLGQVVEDLKNGSLPRQGSDVSHDAAGVGGEALDFSEVRGQGHAKRAIEIAAAGGHNLLMIGPPGTGKTMLARRIETILPPMGWEEAVEVSRILSVAGLLDPGAPLARARPFRSPHHTVSDAGLVGGGVAPRPGEVTLAHHGVLFLDEMPEFKRNVLDLLRQPLEDGRVTIVRAAGAVTFPARFMLVGAMNPCPCGYRGDPARDCTCLPSAVERYRGRLSGPLMDRFDVRVEVPAISYREMTQADAGEPSAAVRARVEAARVLQAQRLKGTGVHCNAQMSARATRRHCEPDPAGAAVLERAMDKRGLSARGYTRVLKVARTIADLSGGGPVGKAHVLEALQFRIGEAP